MVARDAKGYSAFVHLQQLSFFNQYTISKIQVHSQKSLSFQQFKAFN